MLGALRKIQMTAGCFASLICLCGNDFCAGCAVANPKTLVGVYLNNISHFGDLDTEEAVSRLYYSSFLLRTSTSLVLPASRHELFSKKWKQSVRMTIAYRHQTRTASQLLPQDRDLGLQFERMRWCVSEYLVHMH